MVPAAWLLMTEKSRVCCFRPTVFKGSSWISKNRRHLLGIFSGPVNLRRFLRASVAGGARDSGSQLGECRYKFLRGRARMASVLGSEAGR